MNYTLAIDTSNYKTSCALLCTHDRTYRAEGKLLSVPDGTLGLRQSDALFQHVKELPVLLENLMQGFDGTLAAVGVSDRPRALAGSYMPCFLEGLSSARAIAAACRVPLHLFSHQQGHLAAALLSAERLDLLKKPFLAWHLSGGTTELLLVSPGEQGMRAEIIGGTEDISAGQLIDRIGVALGMPFPAGPHVERLALLSTACEKAGVRMQNGYFSLSGMENKIKAHLADGMPACDAASYTIHTVTHLLVRVSQQAIAKYRLPMIVSGGVSACAAVRDALRALGDVSVASPALAGDNAVGTAVLAAEREGILCQ